MRSEREIYISFHNYCALSIIRVLIILNDRKLQMIIEECGEKRDLAYSALRKSLIQTKIKDCLLKHWVSAVCIVYCVLCVCVCVCVFLCVYIYIYIYTINKLHFFRDAIKCMFWIIRVYQLFVHPPHHYPGQSTVHCTLHRSHERHRKVRSVRKLISVSSDWDRPKFFIMDLNC